MKYDKTSIVIAGGGPVGLLMALLLLKSGHDVTIFDSAFAPQTTINDARTLALSYATMQLLNEANVDLSESATPISQVHMSHQGFGVSKIKANDINLPALGFTVKYIDLYNQLKNMLLQYSNCNMTATNVTLKHDKLFRNDTDSIINADLIIIAEGGKLKLPQIEYKNHDYQQTAVIAKLTPQNPHGNIAYERFLKQGSLVLLPHQDDYIIVFPQSTEKAAKLLDYKELEDVLRVMPFMARFGKFKLHQSIASFPLRLQVATNRVCNNMLLIGNAAQTVHPISAQGLNLSVRDVFIFNELVIKYGLTQECLAKYNDTRKKDINFVTKFTHGLAWLFERDSDLVQSAVGVGLTGLSVFKAVQNKLVDNLVFGGASL